MRWRGCARAAVCRTLVPGGLMLGLVTCKPCATLPPSSYPAPHPYTGLDWEELHICEMFPDWHRCPGERPPPAPRCAVTDPDCGPVPMSALYRSDEGERACYRPDKEREPKALHLDQRNLPVPVDVCSHDGECIVNDPCSGARCVGYERSEFVTPLCVYPTRHGGNSLDDLKDHYGLDDVLCGCVQGRCTFFTQ